MSFSLPTRKVKTDQLKHCSVLQTDCKENKIRENSTCKKSVFCTLLPACSTEIPAPFFISSPCAINLIREVVKATKFSNRLISSLIKQYWKRADDSSEKYALESFCRVAKT